MPVFVKSIATGNALNDRDVYKRQAFEEYGYEVELIGRKELDTVVLSPSGESSLILRGDGVLKNPKMCIRDRCVSQAL